MSATPRVIAREGALFALDKPAGLAVHPNGEGVPDLLTWARAELGARDLRVLHRLDRETSGVVLATDDAALAGALGSLFAAHVIVKRYLALVFGRTHEKGIIRRAIADGRREAPLPAVTRFKKLAWLGPTTLVEARPETGRKHQIRKHFQSIGHAVVGDERYRPARFRPVPGFPGRLWLHAKTLELPTADVASLPDLVLPYAGRVFESELPPELDAHLGVLADLERGGLDGVEHEADLEGDDF